MNVRSIVRNELVEDASSVWVLKEHKEFGYSDGRESERYLESVFRKAKDLSYTSSELETHIKDWASEYHLTTKRAQLLSGFTYDRSAKVLEVGCGCGAITRFLGETFDEVVSIEGSLHRARLAKLRTRDLPGVSIICSPFQKIEFTQKFDIIFCIGVYEYSASFVEGENPYDAVLDYFSDLLTPNGTVIIAIENQFGLKYFSSAREDHLGVMFAGIEGYHAHAEKVRTFGQAELEKKLRRLFQSIEFYYPYPDYKLPDCVINSEFLLGERAGELVSQMKSRDYGGQLPPLWDEALVSLELSRNRMLPFFANSFVAIASRGSGSMVSFDQLAIMYSSPERKEFRTRTRILKDADGEVSVVKRSISGMGFVEKAPLKLVDSSSRWQDGYSLHTLVYLNCQRRDADLATIFAPCKGWVALLRELSIERGGRRVLAGEYIDCILSNVYPGQGGYQLVDREWHWGEEIGMNALVIRGLYRFLTNTGDHVGPVIQATSRSGRTVISRIAEALGHELSEADYREFIDLESHFQSIVHGTARARHARVLRWFLRDWATLRRARYLSARVGRLRASISARLSRMARR